jgi:putative transposase
VSTRIAPSAALEAAIEEFLAEGLGDGERLAEIGRLGARLVLQRAVEEEVTAFLGRARHERTPEARGSRNGNRPRQVQTAEGELEIQVPQIRGAAEKFVSSVIPNGRTALRTRPLEALIIGGWVRGLSDRDIESLVSEAGLGQISKSTVSQITKELRARYQAFRARGLREVELLVLFCDAIYLPTRPSGAKEGVLVAWGYDETGQRVLLDVVLGQRERFEDWLEMGRGLVRRRRLRSTNLLERSLEEVKRRTKVIGRFPGETSCLGLCWAVLDLFIASARGLGLTALEHRHLAQMRAACMGQTPEKLTA